MRDLLGRKAAEQMSPLEAQLAALRTVHDQIPAEQRASFLGRLDEVARAWADQPALPGYTPRRPPAEGAFRPDGTLNRPRSGARAWRP